MCAGVVHSKCSNLSDEQIKFLKVVKNLTYQCNACINKSYLDKLQENSNQVELCLETIQEVQKNVNKILEASEKRTQAGDLEEWAEKPYTYADKLKTKKKAVVIQPLRKQESKVTNKFIRDNIQPDILGIGIAKMEDIKNGGVLVQVADQQAKQIFTEKLDQVAGNEYELVDLEERDTKMILLGVDKDHLGKTDEEILEIIVRQNGLEKVDPDVKMKMKIVKKYVSKSNDSIGNIIIGVKNGMCQFFEKLGKLFVGFRSCNIFKYINIIRCYKCFRFSHKKGDCKHQITCGICADDHDTKVCTKREKKCINCITANDKFNMQLDAGHSSFDSKCPCYIQLVQKLSTKSKKSPL